LSEPGFSGLQDYMVVRITEGTENTETHRKEPILIITRSVSSASSAHSVIQTKTYNPPKTLLSCNPGSDNSLSTSSTKQKTRANITHLIYTITIH